MPRIKQFAFALAVTFSALLVSVQAQTPGIEVVADNYQAQFSVQGEAHEMRVEIFSPSGEMIFDSGAVANQSIQWKMQDQRGRRVADGIYLATISVKAASGQTRKHIEQIIVGREQPQSAAPTSPNAVQATITGTGTNGKIAKFIGASTIGNSVMTESSGKIGIGTTTPSSLLHVKAATSTPAITASNIGTGEAITGVSTNSGNGVFGKSYNGAGMYGLSTGDNGIGVIGEANSGTASIGVRGNTKYGSGVFGISSSSGTGVSGSSISGVGVKGTSSSNYGVHGTSDSSSGVRGETSNTTTGAGVYGLSTAQAGNGVIGEANKGTTAFGVWGRSTSGFAGKFSGNVQVTGTLSKSSGSFKIDHPLDPAHKYLYHSFVESPDMMNIYNGNLTTDANGEATVTLPRYFQALNRDFRYQLTVIGEFAQAIISSKIKGNRFTIKTDKPNVEVSWQVTGIRRDAWAEAHRIPVEEEKPEREQGSYLHPELFNQPQEKGIDWALRPELMRQMKDQATPQPSLEPEK